MTMSAEAGGRPVALRSRLPTSRTDRTCQFHMSGGHPGPARPEPDHHHHLQNRERNDDFNSSMNEKQEACPKIHIAAPETTAPPDFGSSQTLAGLNLARLLRGRQRAGGPSRTQRRAAPTTARA
ncbi:hypothetical protein VTK56DRAFT_9274 [Thermocarpiscus australiensis]